ncbi:MAG: family transposase [Cyanobacteria bacterium RYN_339]|nr:family transposase [Cyanobacteria bacterium RYN_339]
MSNLTTKRAFTTDLSESEWAAVAPLFAQTGGRGRPRTFNPREVIDAISYVQRQRISWRSLPQEHFPAWHVVTNCYRAWQRRGIWNKIETALPERSAKGRVA